MYRERNRYKDDNKRKFGTVGKGLFKPVCCSQHEFQGAPEAGGTVRHTACFSERQRQNYPL